MEEDENISTLLGMGFPDIDEIRRALRMAKNDLSEAVAVLTNEASGGGGGGGGGGGEVFGPAPRPMQGSPMLSDASAAAGGGTQDVDMKDAAGGSSQDSNHNGFPVANFFELENRVFQDTWSIPYKADESLGRCLVAAAKMSKEGE